MIVRSAIRAVIERSRAVSVRAAHRWRKPTHHLIHIPKNGGTAIRQALAHRVSLSEPYYHHRYRDIAEEYGHLRRFGIVRNPWSRTYSRYVFSKRTCMGWNDERKDYMERVSFADFVRDRRIFDIPEHPGQPWMGPMTSWFDQLEWLRDENGIVVCDALRLEYLNDDLSAYFGKRTVVPRKNSTGPKEDYRRAYTDELIQIIADTFRADIDHFGFTFDGAATRNIATM